MSKNNSGFFLGALFGAAVAGVTALLYAPKSGKELRADLQDELDTLLERASDYSDYAVERGVTNVTFEGIISLFSLIPIAKK